MDGMLSGGQLVTLLDNLKSPRGLCPSETAETLFIADGKTIKEFDFQQRLVEVVAEGFKQAFDVALFAGGDLGVTDVQVHKVFVMKKEENGRYRLQNTIGTGTTGCADGPSSKAELPEPTGLCFDFNSAIICCFGGFKNGYIKLYSTVHFSCKFMAIYHVIGFLPKKSQNQLAQAGKIHQRRL